MRRIVLSTVVAACFANANAQLTVQSGAVFTIQTGGVVTVQGDVTSNADINGAGKLLLKGTTAQNVSANGFTIPNLEIDNSANATLTSNARIGNSLLFTNGKIILGTNNITLAQASTATGMGANKFIETNGTGVARRELASDITNSIMPVGLGSDYLPVSLTNTGSTYASASIAVQAKAGASSNKHPRTESFIGNTWPITKTGITAGTTNATGTYVDPTGVTGVETELRGFYWNGTQWSRSGASNDAGLNTAGADITSNAGELYAMNRYVLLNSKTFLQGAYNSGTGLMNDQLRTTAAYVAGSAPTGNLLPTADPYRSATYSANFVHVNNANIEVAGANVFNDQSIAADNIVDWVFVELRNTTTPGNAVIQTRAALLQRDGDIVEMDGITPVYFKNNAGDANFSVTVRHRNHLSMSTNPSAFTQALDIQANSTKLDFATIAGANLMGTSNTNYFNNGTVNMLYGGNVNGNANVRYSGASNDRASMLLDLGGVETNIVTGYSRADVNMNRNARYSGANNDRSFLLSNVLSSSEVGIKNQINIP
jgi:hypothetical protein